MVLISLEIADPDFAPPDHVMLTSLSGGLYLYAQMVPLKSIEDEPGLNPISDILVLEEGSTIPPGYEIAKGSHELAFRRSYISESMGECDARSLGLITDVIIVNKNEDSTEGYIKVQRPLCTEGKAIFLAFSILQREETDDIFTIGALIDCEDTVPRWCVARILEREGSKIYVHYEGWSDKWNEWVDIDSGRVAKLRTHTLHETGSRASPSTFHFSRQHVIQFKQCEHELGSYIASENPPLEHGLSIMTNAAIYVADVLCASIDDRFLLPLCNRFLKKFLTLSVMLLKSGNNSEPLLEAVVRIFNGDPSHRRFYDLYGTNFGDEAEGGRFALRRTNTGSSQGSYTSVFLVNCLNHFGKEGGFDVILEYFERCSNGDLQTIRYLLHAITSCITVLTDEFATYFLPKVGKALVSKIKSFIGSDVRDLDKDVVDGILSDITVIVEHPTTEDILPETVEFLKFDFAFRLLTLSSLSKRISGLTQIIDLLSKISEYAELSRNLLEQGHSSRQTAHLSVENAVNWIQKNNIISLLIGHTTHNEIVKRSFPIFKFLTKWHALSRDHISKIWNARIGSHEETVRLLYELLSKLTKYISDDLLDFIFELVGSLDITQEGDLLFQFVDSCCANLAKSSSTTRIQHCIDLLWTILQNSALKSSGMREKAQDTILKLLSSQDCELSRILLIRRCVEAIGKNACVPRNLQLSKELIELFPIESHYSTSRSRDSVIDNVESEFGLSDLIVKNTITYAKSLLDTEWQLQSEPKDIITEELGYRLSFLQFLLSSSSLVLRKEHILDLWETLVKGGKIAVGRSLLLRWLHSIRSEADGITLDISDDLTEFVFRNFLSDPSELDPSTVDVEAFECFELFFRYVNGIHRFMLHPFQQKYMVILKLDSLIGLEFIWSIATQCRVEAVVGLVNAFLVSIYVRLDPILDHNQIWEEFITKCMSYLALSEASKNDFLHIPDLRLIRVLNILSNFLEFCSQEASKMKSFSSFDSHVKFQFPMKILSEKYFDVLFDLLGAAGAISHIVWGILRIIPTNQAFKRALEEPDDVDVNWNLILSCSVFKLLYAFQLIEFEIEDDITWSRRFLNCPGFERMLHVVQEIPVQKFFESEYTSRCICLVFNLISFYMSGPSSNEAFEKFDYLLNYQSFLDFVSNTLRFAIDTTNLCSLFVQKEAVGEVNLDEIETKSNESHIDQSVSLMISICFGVLKHCVHHNPSLAQTVVEFLKKRGILRRGLLDNPVTYARKSTSEGIVDLLLLEDEMDARLVEALKFARSEMIENLLDLLNSAEALNSQCLEYFETIESLFRKSGDDCILGDIGHIIVAVEKKIRIAPIFESLSHQIDIFLCGLLSLMKCLLKLFPHEKQMAGSSRGLNLVDTVFLKLLFEFPSCKRKERIHPPKCKSEQSRKFAFLLLFELVSDCPENMIQLLQHLETLVAAPLENNRVEDTWNFRTSSQVRSETGFVGIKNLGCICYMNALLQQLYMIPSVRKKILEVDDSSEDKSESFMYQLQYMFSFLQESVMQYFDPTQFCHAFKDWDGSPTDITLQKDTNEFLNMLFDRIDNLVKGTKWETCLMDQLGGTFANELICINCPHSSQRDEAFYCLTVNVKNKKTLLESLSAFVEGEILAGDNAYQCSKCDKKIDTVKRVVVKDLPPTLIIHLKRFELNYDTLQMVKLNDYYEFPEFLNMKEYTQEGLAELGKGVNDLKKDMSRTSNAAEDILQPPYEDPVYSERPDTYYKYRLSGILIHTGSAYGGHYYSFIKDRNTLSDEKKGNWFLFNDSIVSKFDPKDIPDECFGGEEVHYRSQYSSAFESEPTALYKTERRRNAYLLFYDRMDEEKASDQKQDVIPNEFQQKISKENITFWRLKYLFDSVFLTFSENLLSQVTSIMQKDQRVCFFACKVCFQFVSKIVARSFYKDSVQRWFVVLEELIELSDEGSDWILLQLLSNEKDFKEIFIDCPIPSIRTSFVSVCRKALKNQVSKEEFSSTVYAQYLKELILPEKKSWRKISIVFALLSSFALAGENAIKLLVSQNFIEISLNLFLAKDIYDGSYGYYNPNPPDFENILPFLARLVKHCPSDYFDPFCSEEVSHRFVAESLSSSQSFEPCAQILLAVTVYLGIDISIVSNALSRALADSDDEEDIRLIFKIIRRIFEIDDRFSLDRVCSVLWTISDELKTQSGYWKATQCSIECLLKLAMKLPLVFQWLCDLDNRHKLVWMQAWLEENSSAPTGFGAIRLHKPKRSRVSYNDRYDSWTPDLSLTSEQKIQALDAIFRGDKRALAEIGVDESDDEELELEVGLFVDCMDKFRNWAKAEILEVTDTKVLVHFDGCSNTCDEWVPLCGNRIASLGQMATDSDVKEQQIQLEPLGERSSLSSEEEQNSPEKGL